MTKKDHSKDIIAYYVQGMHPNEIAARLLLDISTVDSVIEIYESRTREQEKGQESIDFLENELRRGITCLSEKMEVLFSERQFEEFNKSCSNWLEAIKTYSTIIDNKINFKNIEEKK